MTHSEYDLIRCLKSAGNAYLNSIGVVFLTALILPLPSFVLWMEAPLALLSVELTLLDAYYLSIAILLVYGMFGSASSEKISIATLVASILKPVTVFKRSWQFFFSDSPGFWKSTYVAILGIIFGLGAQWIAGPWKMSAEQNLIGAGIYAVCLLFWSQDLTGWMFAPYYLANLSLEPKDAYKRSLFLDKENRFWNLRITAVLCILVPVLLSGLIRYLFLDQADFENFQLHLPLTYVLSIIPWMTMTFSLFLWNEIYKQRIAQDDINTITHFQPLTEHADSLEVQVEQPVEARTVTALETPVEPQVRTGES